MGRKIQFLFQACGLLMLVLLVLRARSGDWSTLNYLMLLVAGSCCLLVFVRFLYVFNYSYALAAMLNGALLIIARPSPAAYLLGAAAVLYGARLFWFSWARQHAQSYAPRMANVIKADEAMPTPVKLALWVNCTLLLTYHLMAVYFAAERGTPGAGVLLGAGVMLAGTLLEGLADWQKQQVKNATPRQPILHGLFRRVRHPNYLGEILLQVGLIVAGLSVVSSASEAVAVLVAPGYIIVLMLSESRRADKAQETTYWDHPDYPAWRARTGSLWPRFTRESSPPGGK